MKTAVILIALLAPALCTPGFAQEACESWHALMQEDEGGPVMTASACAIGRSDAWLLLQCSGKDIGVRYDLSAGAETPAPEDDVADVQFSSDAGDASLSMHYEAMDARHAATTPANGSVIALLKQGSRLTVADRTDRYPERNFSLEGSTAAINKLAATCH